jgi:hypothetical protein
MTIKKSAITEPLNSLDMLESAAATPARCFNRRQAERFSVAPMYTEIRARRQNQAPEMTGHIYDVSATGIRLELDEPVTPGDALSVIMDLPGVGDSVDAHGTVVWLHDELDDPGPRRMALRIDTFGSTEDRQRYARFLGGSYARLAA